MITIGKEARCDKCLKKLDLVEGMEWVPYVGLCCQPCADWFRDFRKRMADIEKERNRIEGD